MQVAVSERARAGAHPDARDLCDPRDLRDPSQDHAHANTMPTRSRSVSVRVLACKVISGNPKPHTAHRSRSVSVRVLACKVVAGIAGHLGAAGGRRARLLQRLLDVVPS